WLKMGEQIQDAPQEIRDVLRQVLFALRLTHRPLSLRDKALTLTPLGDAKLGDRALVGMRVAHKDYRDVDLFFDKETGLMAKMTMQVKEPNNNQDTAHEFLFSDYKDFDGLKHFTKVTFNRDGKKLIDVEFSEVKAEEKLDESNFNKP